MGNQLPVNLVCFVVWKLTDVMSILNWGFLLMFPGLIAYQVSFILKGMELSLSQPGTELGRREKLQKISEQWTLLEFAVRQLRNSRLTPVLLVFNLNQGSQQVCQSYVMFQTVKSGQPDYSLFLDTWHVYQRLFDAPFKYDVETNSFIANPKLRHKCKVSIWRLRKLVAIVFLSYCFYRWYRIIFGNEHINPVEVGTYATATCMTIQALATMYTMERDPSGFVYASTALFKLGGVQHQGWPSSQRLPNLQEILGYGFAAVICLFPVMCCVYPLVLNEDPINTELEHIIPDLPRRLLASILYGIGTLIGAIICSSFLLLILTVCEVFERQTRIIYKQNMKKTFNKIPSRLENFIHMVLKPIFVWLEKARNRVESGKLQNFDGNNVVIDISQENRNIAVESIVSYEGLRQKYNQLRLLMELSNKNVEIFIPAMTCVGMLLCIGMNYSIILLYDRGDLRGFICIEAFVDICINILILFFCHHAILPMNYTNDILLQWQKILTKKVDRKQIQNMRPFGFKLGPFSYVKRETALEINDIIINTTITLILT
ncbi:unnamed protein product [Orchesella dallaii]|uniref:Odorant receptor n=1 Tax=Orchesella dallaii TaxID=48710 RepID=A0ABP1RGM9_9HEXA